MAIMLFVTSGGVKSTGHEGHFLGLIIDRHLVLGEERQADDPFDRAQDLVDERHGRMVHDHGVEVSALRSPISSVCMLVWPADGEAARMSRRLKSLAKTPDSLAILLLMSVTGRAGVEDQAVRPLAVDLDHDDHVLRLERVEGHLERLVVAGRGTTRGAKTSSTERTRQSKAMSSWLQALPGGDGDVLLVVAAAR